MLLNSYREVFQSRVAIFRNITQILNMGAMYSNCTHFYQYHKLMVTEAMGVLGVVLLELPILCFLLH
jgi:hypothetical protein